MSRTRARRRPSTIWSAGTSSSMIVDYPSGAGQIRAGKIRPLAVCSATRLASQPDVPTVQEALGLAGFEAYAWQGLVVPAGTPDPIVERLSACSPPRSPPPRSTPAWSEIGLEPLEAAPPRCRP